VLISSTFFFQEKLLNTVQINCPHLLRYLTCAVIVNKRRKNVLKDIVRVIMLEREHYADPLTDFLRVLYVEFDFESAHQHLQQAQKLIATDFFLGFVADELLEQARQLVFETYARVHSCIDITLLVRRLDMKSGDSEQKMVELIRRLDQRIDVKIDSNKNQIIIETRAPSIYQQVIDKTDMLSTRTTQLAAEVDKKFQLKLEQHAE